MQLVGGVCREGRRGLFFERSSMESREHQAKVQQAHKQIGVCEKPLWSFRAPVGERFVFASALSRIGTLSPSDATHVFTPVLLLVLFPFAHFYGCGLPCRARVHTRDLSQRPSDNGGYCNIATLLLTFPSSQ